MDAVATGEAPADSADAPPAQPHRSLASAPAPWWQSCWLHLAAMAAILGACTGYGISALARRRRAAKGHPPITRAAGRPLSRAVGRPLSRAAGTLVISATLSVVLSSATFIWLILSSNAMGVSAGPLLLGRPIAWLAAQLGGVAAVGSTIALLAGWFADRFPIPSNPVFRCRGCALTCACTDALS